jgi:peptide/nickel transport system permease protein
MLKYLIGRLANIILTMVALSLIVFFLMDFNLPKLARAQIGERSTDRDVEIWLEKEGFRAPFFERYVDWVGGFVTGNMGKSYKKRSEISELIAEKLGNTAYLMLLTMLFMVPTALVVGILAGMKEGSVQDRSLSFLCITSTSFPDYVSGVIFLLLFGVWLQWLPASSRTLFGDVGLEHMILPALALSVYGFGYIARMTRASMAEVMTSQYIRTAILKGLPYRRVIMKHALRNALIAPFTIIVLQIPWLLTGVVAVELLFSYEGFGKLLLEAAESTDLPLVMACAMVTVVVVVVTQVVSDIGYMYLNPRIRHS